MGTAYCRDNRWHRAAAPPTSVQRQWIALVTDAGNNLSLTPSIRFNAGFAGNRIFYLASRDTAEGNNTASQSFGTWAVNRLD